MTYKMTIRHYFKLIISTNYAMVLLLFKLNAGVAYRFTYPVVR